jgi:hypothetical protein
MRLMWGAKSSRIYFQLFFAPVSGAELVTALYKVALISEPGIGANNRAAPTPTPRPAANGKARATADGLRLNLLLTVSTSCSATSVAPSRRPLTALPARLRAVAERAWIVFISSAANSIPSAAMAIAVIIFCFFPNALSPQMFTASWLVLGSPRDSPRESGPPQVPDFELRTRPFAARTQPHHALFLSLSLTVEIGLSDLSKSAAASPVEATSSAPVRSRMSLARLVHSELSQCTERRMPPALIRPS